VFPGKVRRRVQTSRTTTGLSTVLAVALTALAGPVPASAGGSQDGAAVRAVEVFEAHCARCHHSGKLENPPAKGNLGNIVDLKNLVEREDLVVPADPDASRLYQIMQSRHRPLSVFFGPVPGPTPAEIGAVRDWIASVPEQQGLCAQKSQVTAAQIKRDIAVWQKAFENNNTEPLRFISLANLHNLCRSDAKLAAYRDAVAILIGRLTARSDVALDTVGDASVLLAFRPSDLGLTAEAWDLRAGSGDVLPVVVPAEVLAARALAATNPAGDSSNGSGGLLSRAAAAPAAAGLVDGLDPVEALATEFTRTVREPRAAVELGLDQPALRARLSNLQGEAAILAARLIQTGLLRQDWEALKRGILALPNPKNFSSDLPASTPQNLTLSLWTDAMNYEVGDLLSVHVRPNGDCNLTIVAVEPSGLATVLFPNDTAMDNHVKGGSQIVVPASGAPFQLRLDKPGRNGIVAICNATAKRPPGVGHDFERQRFTVLGDWRTFLIESSDREAAYQKTQDDLRRFRTGAGRAETLEEQLPLGTEDEARAALTLIVSP
jgi:hypothetical protein